MFIHIDTYIFLYFSAITLDTRTSQCVHCVEVYKYEVRNIYQTVSQNIRLTLY